jgi:hypothetical protein
MTPRHLAALAAIAAAACGPDGAAHDAPSADASTDAPIDAAVRPFEGWVFFANRQLPGGAESQAVADFRRGPVFAELGVLEPCLVAGPSTSPRVSAGPLSVEGGAAPFTLAFDAATGYRPTSALPTPLYGAGETLTVTAPGDQVGVFGGFARGRVPLAGVTMPASFSRSSGASFSWTGETQGEIWIWLRGPTGSEADGFLFCRTADLGNFTIPAEAMAFVPASYSSITPSVLRVDDVRITTADTVGHVIAAWEVVGDERSID